jgi:hypothetical protein
LSGAIVFARSGFPFSVLSELSDMLEKSAKGLRKDMADPQPCLDVYWLESTARENPIIARRSTLAYESGGQTYSLNTRPWTLQETEAMWDAARLLQVPRGKRHQLLAGLWSGEPLASFHYQRWLQHLSSTQKVSFQAATKKLEDAGLWKFQTAPWFTRTLDGQDHLYSPLLELHELCEMAGSVEDAGSEEGPA